MQQIVNLSNQKKEIELRLYELNQQRDRAIKKLHQQQVEIQQYYTTGKENADKQLNDYCKSIKQAVNQELNVYQQKIDVEKQQLLKNYQSEKEQIDFQLQSVKNELEKIEATRAAAQEAFLKEEKIKSEKEFYSLQLEDKSLHDIKILQSVEAELIDPRPLKMAIWTSCYSKRVNDLCSRIFGTAKKTGIYKITFLPTGQCYIGQARDLKERIREHCKAGFAQIDTPANNKLYEMMKKYPISDFTFELLQECPIDQLNEKEKYYIKLYQSYDFGFNSNKGIG